MHKKWSHLSDASQRPYFGAARKIIYPGMQAAHKNHVKMVNEVARALYYADKYREKGEEEFAVLRAEHMIGTVIG